MKEYPVTLDEFKTFFLREAGLEYQEFPSWVKTIFDTNEYCFVGTVYYKSLVDCNLSNPLDVPESEEDEPQWEQMTKDWEEGTEYNEGDIVFYINAYYRCLGTTSEIEPDNGMFWESIDVEVEFPEAREWAKPIVYNIGDKAICIMNYKLAVVESQMDDNYSDPKAKQKIPETDEEAWLVLEEETDNLTDVILDLDIERAMGEAEFKFNHYLFTTERGRVIFLYLTMFFLVNDRQAAAQGLSGNAAAGPVVSRTVGKMSVTYAQSSLFKNYPSYEFLSSNPYGKKAFNLMMPYLRGNIQLMAAGSTGD